MSPHGQVSCGALWSSMRQRMGIRPAGMWMGYGYCVCMRMSYVCCRCLTVAPGIWDVLIRNTETEPPWEANITLNISSRGSLLKGKFNASSWVLCSFICFVSVFHTMYFIVHLHGISFCDLRIQIHKHNTLQQYITWSTELSVTLFLCHSSLSLSVSHSLMSLLMCCCFFSP
jgi:hypothetical protein